MNKRTGKLLSLLLTLAMVLGMLPAMSLTAFAAEPGISITGTTDSSGTGWSYVNSTKTLTLNDYNGGYIQGSGLNTLNLVLEGTSTITVDDANAKGIALENNQNLNISGSGSLTINATGGSNLIYGIECNKFTMTSGTVTINANSSKMVYGVNANSSLSVTGGKLTANITGTSDGRGLYCKTGKLTVGSGAEVAVKVTNNGSNAMYGIYNEAYTATVTDNGDIELAGTVTITRDSGSTGSGIVYGIANGGSGNNSDGVISITGGSVTVTNAYYGIAAFTKGHDTAFADVDISGGTVDIASTTSDSLGIVSWNNGVTISGGTVTAGTASKALWLADSDSTNKTGLVKITGDAKVSLTSTDYKALIVQGDESNTSTRVHQINLTSGGSVTVKSTSSEETNYAFPVQGYFNLGSSTKITEGSFRAVDGTNAGGGKLFVADNTTKQVVVAYSTLYTGAGAVSVNGHSFASDKLYYKNGSADTTDDSTDYNAHYDPATGVLELKDYNSGPIIIGGSNAYDLTVKLTGTNTVTTDAPLGGAGNVCVGINITNADNVTFIGDGTLTVNTNAGSGLTQVFGIWLDRSAAAAENLTFQSGKVTVNVTATDTDAQVFGVSTGKSTVGGPITVAEGAELNVTLNSASTGLANGLLSKGNITLNGKTAITLTYTGSGSPNASNWTSVSAFSGDNKLNVGANAAITVDMPDTYSLTNGMGPAYYAAKSDSQIGDGDWTNTTASEQYFENDSFLVTRSVSSGYGYADYKYEVIDPLTFEDKADYDIPAGTKDDSYTAATALTATGGSGEYRYEFEGTKPSELSINAENKLVYTRASVCDATTAIVKVTDKGGISKSITIDIGAVTATSPGTGTVPHIDNKTVTVGTDVFVSWPEGATAFQRFEGSTQVGSGDKSGYPSGMYIPAESSPTTKTFKFKVQFSGGWVESNEFTVTWTAATSPAATVGNVTVSGTKGTAITSTDVTVTLTNDTFGATLSGNWITNLPAGLTQSVTRTDDTHAKITVTGTPTATSTAAMTIVIPDAQLVTSSSDLTVTSNANAKFNITLKSISGATITLGTLPAYNGSEQAVTISKVEVGGSTLSTSDYEITSGNKATNVGNTTLTITGKGNYDGTATTTWSLQKATPTATDFTLPTDLTKNYTGSPITVSAPTLKSGKTGAGTITVKYGSSATAPTNAGSYTVTFDVAAGTNYNAATGLSIGTLTINKVAYTGTTTVSDTVRSGQTTSNKTLTLPTLPAGASYGTVTTSGALISGTPTVSGNTLTYNTTSQTNGTSATITIAVTGATNYNDYNVVVTVTAKDKEDAGVTIADSTKTVTYGSNVTVTASATATGGTWSWNYPSDTFEAVGATNGASITLKPLKATTGAATVTAKYESETHIGEATASVTVGKKNVTITGLSASSKEYDGNTTATVNGTAVVSGKVGSDDVTVTAGTAAFANKTVGNNKTVTFSGYSLSGAAAGNYNLTAQPASVTANITAKPVTVTVTATNRDYVSGNRNVVLVAGSVTGIIGGDAVNVDVSGATGTMENEDAGTGKAVTVTGVALSGTDAGNYNLTAQPTGVTVTINKKNYDGSITGNKNVHTNQAQTGVTFDMSEKFGVIKGAAVKSVSEGTDSDNLIDNVSFDGNVVKFDVASIADAGKTATINVVISCTNFNDITAVLTVKTVDKDEAGVTISGVPAEAKTYGDADLTLTALAATPGANGTWTWETSDSSVLQLTPNGNKVTVKLLKAGKATVTAKYESDTTIGQLTTANIRVEKATITVAAKNQSIYVNGTVPDLTSPVKDTHYTVTGLAAGDTLGGTLTMKYQKDGVDATPDATKTGTYDIVISGATAPAGGNYNDVVFTAGTLTISNRPSSGGGGGGSTPITVPVSDPKNQVKVTVTVSGTTATVQKIDLSKIDQAQGVTIDFTGLGRTIESAKLPTSAIKEIGATESGALTVKLTAGSVTFDNAALKAVADQAGSQITLTLTPVKTSTLNASQKEAVGDAPVFDLQLLSGSKAITDFKGGNVTVTLPHTLSKGQEPAGVVVYYLSNDGNPEACKTTYDAKSKLVTFTTTHFSLYFVGYKQPAAEWENPFTDVAEGAWYYDSIKYVYSNGMMVGTGDTKFSPDTTTTRGMIVTILYRLEGEPAVSGTSSFNDVASGRWYANAVKWAAENEIVGGYGNGNFGPEDPISREQMAAILYRYAAFKGFDITKTADLSKFTDSSKISDWSKAALSWANAEGLVNGKGGGILDPLGKATRAEIATILRNFCENVVK